MEQEIKVLFVAIPIVEQHEAFTSMQEYFQRTLNSRLDRGTFRASKDLHITIAYIGSVQIAYIPMIEQALEKAIDQFCAASKEAHLVWQHEFALFNNAVALTFAYDAGVHLLAQCIREALGEHKIPFDDRYDFETHLTIGRIKPNKLVKKNHIRSMILDICMQETEHELDPIRVEQIGLYESGHITPFKTYTI